MRVLQVAKRSVTLFAAVSVALTGCGDSGPDVPFNPAGTSADIQAVNAAFGSSSFASFSSLSPLFGAALGGAPLVSSSAAAMDIRASGAAGMRAAAVRSARRLAGLLPAAGNKSFSASSAGIPVEIAGKTFEYSGGAYVAGTRTGAPANGVRFLLYAVDPVTFMPVEPLVETGRVDITDLSGTSTQSARVEVVSGTTTFLDYTVTANSVTGRVTVVGFVTDGTNRANLNLRATVTSAGDLTLVYSLDVPQRDVSIDLTLTATGLTPESGTITINLSMSGPNGTVSMAGQFTVNGASLTVRTSGRVFATITVTGQGAPVITGADGLPITEEDIAALQGIFELTSEAFISFDQMLVPVTFFLAPAA
jgi:predicted small lipoprotein YifL